MSTVEWRRAHPEIRLKWSRKWNRENRGKLAKAMREYHARKRDKTLERLRQVNAEHPERARAYATVLHALKTGRLKKPSQCQACGQTKTVQAHHDDYSKRLEVKWLCRECHAKVHGMVKS